MKGIFNTVRKARPSLGDDGPAKKLRVFIKLFNINTQIKRTIQLGQKSWPVIWDVGEHGPDIELRVFEKLLNIKHQSKAIFNTVRKAGP